MYKKELLIGVGCFILGAASSFFYFNHKLNSNKKLTKRILSSAIVSMEASQNLTESCFKAYNTVTACAINIRTCNMQEEAKKLDKYNDGRKKANEQIYWINKDIENTIKEIRVSK